MKFSPLLKYILLAKIWGLTMYCQPNTPADAHRQTISDARPEKDQVMADSGLVKNHIIQIEKLEKYKLPSELLKYLGDRLPDYQVIDTTDYFPAWSLEVIGYKEGELPFFMSLNFNGDEYLDYALLLSKQNQLELLLFESKEEKIIGHQVLTRTNGEQRPGKKEITYGIQKKEKGLHYGLGQEARLKYEGIEFIKFGASSRIYFLDSLEIKKMFTGT